MGKWPLPISRRTKQEETLPVSKAQALQEQGPPLEVQGEVGSEQATVILALGTAHAQ